MNFDSSINNPFLDAENVIINYKFSNHALRRNKPVDYYKDQMLLVLKERFLHDKTLRQCADMLNIKSKERVRQIEAKTLRILRQYMKGYK